MQANIWGKAIKRWKDAAEDAEEVSNYDEHHWLVATIRFVLFEAGLDLGQRIFL